MVIPEEGTTIEHCIFCNYCIVDLDHHCPWSSKCIGRGNIVAFKLFLMTMMTSIVYVVGIFAYVAGQ